MNYTGWSDDQLATEQARLATERTQIRLAQLEVAAELEIRAAIAALSEPARRIVSLRLEGAISPEGAADHA